MKNEENRMERTRKDGDVIGLYEDSGNGEIGEWTGA